MENSALDMLAPILAIGIVVFLFASLWRVFAKAGHPGWTSLIPIYNGIVLLQIAGRPLWWFILFLIPFVNMIVAIVVAIDVARAFGKGAGFGLGLAFLSPVFYPILGFGSAQYVGATR